MGGIKDNQDQEKRIYCKIKAIGILKSTISLQSLQNHYWTISPQANHIGVLKN